MKAKTVHRWEAGERTPQMAQRVELATALDWSIAQLALALNETDASPLNGHAVPSHLTHFASLEQAATELRSWEPLAVPGLLQTADYATAVERTSVTDPSEAEIARRVEFRLARQHAIHRGAEPLHLFALLDASVLLRETGGRAVMAAQLDRLAELSSLPNVQIRVTPLDGRVFAAPGAFRLLSGEGHVPYLACTENLAGVQYLEGPSVVEAYTTLFAHLWRNGDELEKVKLFNGER